MNKFINKSSRNLAVSSRKETQENNKFRNKNYYFSENTFSLVTLESYCDYLFNISLAHARLTNPTAPGNYSNYAASGYINYSENYLKYNSLLPVLLNKKIYSNSNASPVAIPVENASEVNSVVDSGLNNHAINTLPLKKIKIKSLITKLNKTLSASGGNYSTPLLNYTITARYPHSPVRLNAEDAKFKILLNKVTAGNKLSISKISKVRQPATYGVNSIVNKGKNATSAHSALFKSLEGNLFLHFDQHNAQRGHSKEILQSTSENSSGATDRFNKLFNYDSRFSGTEENLAVSESLSPFFDFLIDNKNINKLNKIGLKKILSEFKLFRHVRYSGVHTGPKQIISYSFTKNINRTNTLNSFDHTGSLLKISISVILKYFFNIMGLSLISRPFFIFSHNKVNIQISYFMFRKFYFNNKTIKNWNDSVSTLSTGMEFHWLITNKLYRNIPKKDLPESGRWPSEWAMNSFYSNRKPFDEKVKPFYPGNIPYLSQSYYNYAVFRRVRQLKKFAGGYWSKSSNKYIKKKINSLNIRKDNPVPYIRNTLSFFYQELNALTYILEKFFNCSIKLDLNRIKNPFSDPNIMAQLVGINGEEAKFEKVKKSFIYKIFYCNPNMPENRLRFHKKSKPFYIDNINSYFTQVSGYKMRVAGRFYKHKIVPRKTVSTFQRGSMARGVINVVQKARYVNKSKRGSFSVTV
jgi:hypothetical protein